MHNNSHRQPSPHLIFFHYFESFLDYTQDFVLLTFFRVRNIEQVLQLAPVIPV